MINNITVDIIIREFDISDIKEMVRIDTLCFPPAQKFDEEVCIYYLYTLPSISLIIEDSADNIIGFIILSRIKKTILELVTIDIKTSIQGKKPGSFLFEEGIEHIEEIKREELRCMYRWITKGLLIYINNTTFLLLIKSIIIIMTAKIHI